MIILKMIDIKIMIGGGQDPQGVRLKQGKGGPGGRGKLFLANIFCYFHFFYLQLNLMKTLLTEPHTNVVRLLGCCTSANDKGEKILIIS